MLEKTKYILCMLSLAFCIGVTSNLYAQMEARLIGGAGLVLDARSTPYRAITIDVPTTLSLSYLLHLPATPPPGPVSSLASDASGNMFWTASGTATLPPLPPGNIWVGNALSVAMPYAPTVPGAVMILNGSNVPTWSTTVPPGSVPFNVITNGTNTGNNALTVGNGSVLSPSGTGLVTANNLVGAANGNYAGQTPISIGAVAQTITLNAPYQAMLQAGSAIVVNIIDNPNPGVAVYLVSINPGSSFTVAFSAAYPTNTGKLSYHIVNP